MLQLRQVWLYIIYSSPLTNEIAGITDKKKPPIYNVEYAVPPSRLSIKGKEIIHADGEIDYLIIGSGPAGSVIAHELTRKKSGSKIVLIEAGSFVKPLSTLTELSPELMESNNLRRAINSNIIIRNGATDGGGSTVNLDLAFSPLLPSIKEKLQSWIDQGSLPSYFCHQKDQDWAELEHAYSWVSRKLMTRQVNINEINKNNFPLKEGATLAETYCLNSRNPNDPHITALLRK
ncbi:NAD(P)-binding protein [Candidatus Odyssella acanthamoebae]|uniref:Uncharacterized protein n=1 Tax=Candidatus Odyssella acanthamoebae TaxID=91604 RepID=A0A077AWC8_9PROT|nr:FAD/NAD(P)-binding oxidoreductase [Candidatus Paracaedibacter acanthamoebae]AIK96736.1 hypothetical protein ID47_08390 [Candidatus Paracaedibacter acanthamoebae]